MYCNMSDWSSSFGQNYAMNQAMRNMENYLGQSNRLELIGTFAAFVWLIGGLFSDPFLLILALSVSIAIFILLSVWSLLPLEEYYYDIHSSSFRRLLVAAIAHWGYTTGSSQGPDILDTFGVSIPVLKISQYVMIGLVILWFGTRYYDQLQDENITDVMLPFLILRGLLRGAMIAGMIFAIASGDYIPKEWQLPWLFAIYLIEPYLFSAYQFFNKTYSTMELTFGNARLPIVALRESFISNLIILFITMMADGVTGDEWNLLRAYYLLGAFIIFFYSWDSIKRFNEHPLGTDPLGEFLTKTPKNIENFNIDQKFGHVVKDVMDLDLTANTSLQLDKDSIIIPIEEQKDKISAIVVGKGQSIIDDAGMKFADKIEGVSTVLIPKKTFREIQKGLIAQKLTDLDFNELNLPNLVEIENLIMELGARMSGFVSKLEKQLSKINLSNYGVTVDGDREFVNLPGIMVSESPEMTNVKVANLRVIETPQGTAVRWGGLLNVIELPKFTFVNLPGITVLELPEGTAVDLLGFKISDGVPADRLDEVRRIMLGQMDRWEAGLDAQLGRILADNKASGLFTLGYDGQFTPLLEGKKQRIGAHSGIQSLPASSKKSSLYLPANFDELEHKEQDNEFLQLTGITDQGVKSKDKEKRVKIETTPSRDKSEDQDMTIEDLNAEIESVRNEIKEKKRKEYDFKDIIDVEPIEEDDENIDDTG